MSARVSRRQLAKSVVDIAADRGWKTVVPALAKYLVQSRQTGELELLINDIKQAQLEKHGLLEVDVITARKLNSELERQISSVMKRHTGAREVTIHSSIDEDLLGGAVARTPELELDLSLRTKLNSLMR